MRQAHRRLPGGTGICLASPGAGTTEMEASWSATKGDADEGDECTDRADTTSDEGPADAGGRRFTAMGIPKKRWRTFIILSGSIEEEKEAVAQRAAAS